MIDVTRIINDRPNDGNLIKIVSNEYKRDNNNRQYITMKISVNKILDLFTNTRFILHFRTIT